MKNSFLLCFLIVSGFFLNELLAQSFQTGSIGIEVNNYGRVRVHSPSIGNLRQIDRSSILVGVNANEVFDYKKDAGTDIPPFNVVNPLKSDYEIYAAYNNSWSSLPPNVLVRLSVYGWQNLPIAVCKFTVVNNEASTLNAFIGIEFIPQPDGTYGLETVKYNLEHNVGYSFRDASPKVGFKIFSNATYSFHAFNWTESYYDPDSLLWGYLTYGQFDTSFVAGGDGSVAVLTQEPVAIAPNDSVHFYVGIAVGSTDDDLFQNMLTAQQKYASLVSVDYEQGNLTYDLRQNYPNPFNPKTRIDFQIPVKEKVSLKIYNILGTEILELLNKELEPGRHSINFDGSNLMSGVYFYRIQAGSFTSTKKMILLK